MSKNEKIVGLGYKISNVDVTVIAQAPKLAMYINAMREIEQQRWGDDVAMHGTTVPKYKQEFTVGKGKVFVMGDNRNNSKDSRSREYGEMDENRILGRVIIRLTPDFGIVE